MERILAVGLRVTALVPAVPAASSATGLCTLVRGLKIKLKHYYLKILWRKSLDWPKICCDSARVGVQEQTVR